jgi:hypothetical protein
VNRIISDFKKDISLSDLNVHISQKFYKKFVKHVSSIPGIQDFILIGDKTLKIEDSEMK